MTPPRLFTVRTVAVLLALALGACSRSGGNVAPPRVETPAELPQQTSSLVVPVVAPLADLEKGINEAVPKALWRVDKLEPHCIPAQRVKVFGKRLKVTPDLGCRIVGEVTRGRITLSGKGSTLAISLPVSAVISARDVGGIIKKKTATGAAVVRAFATLSLDRSWTPTAKVDIAYDWTDPPGIDFLGQRIRFVGKADEKLKGVIAGLQRQIPKELAKLRTRERLADIWQRSFTSIMLNRDKPPAWMRITPQRLGFGGYRVSGRQLVMTLSAEALTETFVGNRPADPTPTPLPPPSTTMGPAGLRFYIPVLADFAQLEPVVQRTLRKRAAKGITLTGIGPVDAQFGKVTIYATEGGRLAVGINTVVKAAGHNLTKTHGIIWLSALPYNDPGTQIVHVRDLKISGETDSHAVNMLFTLFEDPDVLDQVRAALSHDFAPDYQKVLTAARKAITGHREGDFLMSADVTSVRNGELKVTGQGLFLPVQVNGRATVSYRPR